MLRDFKNKLLVTYIYKNIENYIYIYIKKLLKLI